MTDATSRENDEATVRRREFNLVKEMFKKQFEDHETLDKERHAVLERDIKAIRENYHSLANRLAPLFSMPDRMERMEDELKEVPRKQDLEYITQSVKAGFQGITEERQASERRIARYLTILGIVVTVIIATITIAVNVLRH